MPEIFINGQPVQAEANQTVLQAALANGFYIPYFCWHQAAVHRRQLPHLHGPGRRPQLGRDLVQHAGDGRPARADRLRPGARAPQGDDAVHHAQPSGRLRHLRQGRRVHAAGLSLRVQRLAVGFARAQGARDQVPRPVRANPARQRALHPLLALRALHARDLEVERARHQEPRRRVAGARRRRFAARRRSRTPTTSSTSARSARCCPSRSCTRRASGT